VTDRGYKRSWKNLLINKRYQLRFTLFMVGISAALMAGLGWWVMHVANEQTTISIESQEGVPCPLVPTIDELPPPPPLHLPDPAPDDGEEHHAHVQIDESSMTLTVQVPKDFAERVVRHYTCTLNVASTIEQLKAGRYYILYALIAVGALLCLGLAVYGIKMTHKVAGPLFKVSTYMQKMRDGRLDKVWPLRKGDQLVDFYDHFRTAHAGLVTAEHTDIEKLRALVAAAEDAGIGQDPSVIELRELLARKEASVA
jgi:hypothetical protein